MGSVCCVAARDSSVVNTSGRESLNRNVACSPTLSFRWDHQRRVAGEVEESSFQVLSGANSNKGAFVFDRVDLPAHGGLLGNSGTPNCQKSLVLKERGRNCMTPVSDLSGTSNFSTEVKDLAESPDVLDPSANKLSFSIPSPFSPTIPDNLSSRSQRFLPNSTPSRRARRSPGHQLFRQVSDSRILGLKSSSNSISEGRSSFVLSACSNDVTAGSNGGSFDGWSMRTFSELVASSQRERWSFDSEHFGSVHGKISGHSGMLSYSPSLDIQPCGACSQSLTERSSWSSQRLVANNEFPMVAVLVCGHVFHAECLETIATGADRYDPACPICMVGEKQVLKLSRKALKAEAELKVKHLKILRKRVVNGFVDDGCDDFEVQDYAKQPGKDPKLEPSSSRSSLAKPFLKRHFSIGSRWGRSISESNSSRKRGFWARHRRD